MCGVIKSSRMSRNFMILFDIIQNIKKNLKKRKKSSANTHFDDDNVELVEPSTDGN